MIIQDKNCTYLDFSDDFVWLWHSDLDDLLDWDWNLDDSLNWDWDLDDSFDWNGLWDWDFDDLKDNRLVGIGH